MRAPVGGGSDVDLGSVTGAVLALAVLVYLMYALLRPEKF
jgi:K+-transporting ATPase KdpF subunit